MFEKEAGFAETKMLIKCNGDYSKKQDYKKGWLDGADFGYNKCKEELNQKGLALQSDMDKTIEQNIALKKELNKANEWHFVKDKLPKDNEYVLIYTELKNIYVVRVSTEKDYFVTRSGEFVLVSAGIAWKEIVLPELPKESE